MKLEIIAFRILVWFAFSMIRWVAFLSCNEILILEGWDEIYGVNNMLFLVNPIQFLQIRKIAFWLFLGFDKFCLKKFLWRLYLFEHETWMGFWMFDSILESSQIPSKSHFVQQNLRERHPSRILKILRSLIIVIIKLKEQYQIAYERLQDMTLTLKCVQFSRK